MACGAFASAPSSSSATYAAGAADPASKPYGDLSSSLTMDVKNDYYQLKRDWLRLSKQNKVALGVTAGIGAAAIVVVVILAIMLARRS
jgi:hypothetical protein